MSTYTVQGASSEAPGAIIAALIWAARTDALPASVEVLDAAGKVQCFEIIHVGNKLRATRR